MRALNRTWQQVERDHERVGPEPQAPDAAEAVLLARERVSAADTACYYAHRRYQQSGSPADREDWEARRRECERAAEALREAERREQCARTGQSPRE